MLRRLGILFVLNFLIALTFNMMTSLLPIYLNDLGASVSGISFIMFTSGIISTIAMIISGILSSSLGLIHTIALSFLMIGLSAIGMALCSNWIHTLPYAILLSCSLSLFIPPRMLLIAEYSKPSRMGLSYGMMNLAWPLGILLGPSLGGLIVEYGKWSTLFSSILIISLISIPFCTRLKSSNSSKVNDDYSVNVKTKVPISNKRFLITITIFIIAHLLLNTGRGILDPILPIYLRQKFRMSISEIGLFLSFGLGLSILIIQLPSGIIGDKVGHKKALSLFIAPIPFLTFIWPLIEDPLMLVLVCMCIIGLWSGTWSNSIAYIVRVSPLEMRTLSVVLRQIAIRAGLALGSLISGWLWESYGESTPFYGSAIIILLSLIFMLLLPSEDNNAHLCTSPSS